MTRKKEILVACLSAIVLSLNLTANVSAREASADEWNFTLAPFFLWGVSIDGSNQIGPVETPLDISFTDDVLSNLSTVFTFHFEAQKGDWTMFAEYQYVELDPVASIAGGPTLDIDFTDQMGEFGAFYRFASWKKTGFEALLGARYTSQDIGVKLASGTQLIDVEEGWWDGFIGLRSFTQLSENWTLIARGDIGGGGSNFVWNLEAVADYRFKEWGSVFFGYRWMDYDYETGSGVDRFTYDALQQGILAGLALHW